MYFFCHVNHVKKLLFVLGIKGYQMSTKCFIANIFVFEVLSTLICIFIVKVCLFLSWLNIETQLKEMKYNCLWKWNETTVLLILWYGERKQPQETFYLFAFYCWFKVFAKSVGIHFIILTSKSKFYLIENTILFLMNYQM